METFPEAKKTQGKILLKSTSTSKGNRKGKFTFCFQNFEKLFAPCYFLNFLSILNFFPKIQCCWGIFPICYRIFVTSCLCIFISATCARRNINTLGELSIVGENFHFLWWCVAFGNETGVSYQKSKKILNISVFKI